MGLSLAQCQVIEVCILLATSVYRPGRYGEFCFDGTRRISCLCHSRITFGFPVIISGNDQIRIGVGLTYRLCDTFQIVTVKGDMDAVPCGFMDRCTVALALGDDPSRSRFSEDMHQA